MKITKKCDQEYKKCRYELVKKPNKKRNRKFLYNDLASRVIKDCRTAESCNFKINLVSRLHDVITTKEQTVLE